jgi:hypothetical protein
MKRFVLGTAAAAILSGMALTSGAQAAPFGHRHVLTPYERTVVAKSQANLNRLTWRVRADGRVTPRERALIAGAQARHNALVWRLRRS